MDQDRIIRTTIISLGMSGKKADDIRTSFERSSATIYALGGNLEDVLKIMTGLLMKQVELVRYQLKQLRQLNKLEEVLV